MSALLNQLGAIAEVTYGTYLAPTRFWEFEAETLALTLPRVVSAGHRPGDEVIRSDHWMTGKRTAGGTFTVEVANKGMGILFSQGLGTTTITADGLGWKQSNKLGDQLNKSMTLQVGRSDSGGPTVQPFSYMGCKITDLVFTQDVEMFLKLAVTIDAQDESTAQTLAVSSNPTVTEIFNWNMFTVSVGGSPLNAGTCTGHIQTPMKVDRFLSGSALKKQPIRNAKRVVGGTLSGEFESLTAYARFTGGTAVPIVYTWTGLTTYDTAKFYKLVITFNNCRLDGTTPNTNAEDLIVLNQPFEATYDGTLEAVTVDYFTADAAI